MYLRQNHYGGKICMNRRAQEEIVGFVVVVVLLAIVLLVFLSFMLRSPPATRESVGVSQLAQGVLAFTTSCSLSSGSDYASVGEVLSACAQNNPCADESSSCTILNETITTIMMASLHVGNDTVVKGYTFNAHMVSSNSTDTTSGRLIFSVTNGTCTSGKQHGSSDFQPTRGSLIRSELTVCR